jgi:hypothetical protein
MENEWESEMQLFLVVTPIFDMAKIDLVKNAGNSNQQFQRMVLKKKKNQ